jgi:protein tyrosine phosphatase
LSFQIGLHKYICTQAPLHNTVADFHRMIWETKARTIVMLTKNIEGGKVKAFEYLPKSEPTADDDIVDEDDKQKSFGDLVVRAEETVYSADKSYSLTTFTEGKGGEIRKCKRYQFLDWPDHKVPETAKLLNMIDKVNDEIKQNPDIPVIIHCRYFPKRNNRKKKNTINNNKTKTMLVLESDVLEHGFY